MLVCLGGTILVLFATSMILSQLRSMTGSNLPSLKHVFGVFDLGFAILTNAMLFSLVYRWLPKKPVAWFDAMRGGLLAAIIWELGRTAMGMFLIGMRYTSAYGAIGSFIAILLWCYYGISILFFGAEYVQVLELKRRVREAELQPIPVTQENINDITNEVGYNELPSEGVTLSESGRQLSLPDGSKDRLQPRRISSIR
jgi:membrane protein